VNDHFEHKRNKLFIVLAGIFLTNAIVAELIGVKIFSMLGYNFTAGVVIWPVVFITSDLINEYFGKPGVKRISYLAAFFIAYSFLVIYMTMGLPPSQWWLDANKTDSAGNYFNMNFAFNRIFGQGQRIIVASLAAFLLGQLVDVYVFQKLRKVTGSKMLWLRATGSTIVSQFIDSFVVLYLAFTGIYSSQQINSIGTVNYIYKFVIAILLTPMIYVGHYVIDRYLGKENAEKLSEESASQSGSFF
jgi:uncharacterized integral membrane protein (TIGR00697 family)